MQDLISFIAMELVDSPEAVKVNLTEAEDTVTIELTVASGDLGKVIGKQGRIAKAIRSVDKAASLGDNKKVDVDII